MKLFLKIFASITGAGAAIGIIIGVYAYLESLKPQPPSVKQVQEIVQEEIKPLAGQMQTIINNQVSLFNNQELMKNSLVSHMKKDKGIDKYEDIINLINGFRNDVMQKLEKQDPYIPSTFRVEKFKEND